MTYRDKEPMSEDELLSRLKSQWEEQGEGKAPHPAADGAAREQSQGAGQEETTDAPVDQLLEQLRMVHADGIQDPTLTAPADREEPAADDLDDFDFDDRPIEADYLNYNMIGRNLESPAPASPEQASPKMASPEQNEEAPAPDDGAALTPEEDAAAAPEEDTAPIPEEEKAEDAEISPAVAEDVSDQADGTGEDGLPEVSANEDSPAQDDPAPADPLYEAIRQQYIEERGLAQPAEEADDPPAGIEADGDASLPAEEEPDTRLYNNVENKIADVSEKEIPTGEEDGEQETEAADADEEPQLYLHLDWPEITKKEEPAEPEEPIEPEEPVETEELTETEELDELEELDALEERKELDELKELDALEEREELDEIEELGELDEPDEIEASDMPDDLILPEENGEDKENGEDGEDEPWEAPDPVPPADDDGLPDYDLSNAFGLVSLDSNVAPKKRGRGATTPIEEPEPPVRKLEKNKKRYILPSKKKNGEYTAPSQKEYIKKGYRKQMSSEIMRLGVLLLLTVVAFATESLPLIGVTLFSPEAHPAFTMIVSVLLILGASFCLIRELTDGVILLFHGHPIPESFLPFMILSPLAYYLSVSFQKETTAVLLGFAFCLGALLFKGGTILRVAREARAFFVLIADTPKRVVAPLSAEQAAKENAVFGPYLSNSAGYFSVKRTLFVSDYFKATNTLSQSKLAILFFLPLSLAGAVGIFLLGYAGGKSLPSSFSYASLSLLYTLPLSSSLLYEIPLLWAQAAAGEEKAAFIGEAAVEEYAAGGVMSFSDADLFPPSHIALVNITLFDERRIEALMNDTALIFDEINSPVGTVLLRAGDVKMPAGGIRIANVYDDGIEAIIAGEEVLTGSYRFMEAFGALFPTDYTYEPGLDSQLFTSVNGVVLGRLDFNYQLDPDMKASLQYLADAGLYAAVRTMDPNLTPAFLAALIGDPDCPVKLIKAGDDRERLRMRKHLPGNVISSGNTRSLMNALVLCSKSDYVRKIGIVLAGASLFSGLAIVVLSLYLDSQVFFSGYGIGLFHLFWLLPILLISSLFLRNRHRKKKKKEGKTQKKGKK